MSNADYNSFIKKLREIPDLDVDYAIRNIGGSVFLYVKVLEKVIRMFPSNLEQMKSALDAGDMNTFGIRAHGMKGSFKQVCSAEAASLAEALEKAAKQGNLAYCAAHYKKYAAQASHFYEQIRDAMRNAGISLDSETIRDGNIQDFLGLLKQAKSSAEDFDAASAASFLSPLTGHHFDEKTDLLILKAAEEAEAFRPRKALMYITEILDNL